MTMKRALLSVFAVAVLFGSMGSAQAQYHHRHHHHHHHHR